MSSRRRPVDVRPDRLATERAQTFGVRLGWFEAATIARAEHPEIPGRAFDLAANANFPFPVAITPRFVTHIAAIHAMACSGFTPTEKRIARAYLDTLCADADALRARTKGAQS